MEKKKMISVLLSAVMAAGLIPAPVSAAASSSVDAAPAAGTASAGGAFRSVAELSGISKSFISAGSLLKSDLITSGTTISINDIDPDDPPTLEKGVIVEKDPDNDLYVAIQEDSPFMVSEGSWEIPFRCKAGVRYSSAGDTLTIDSDIASAADIRDYIDYFGEAQRSIDISGDIIMDGNDISMPCDGRYTFVSGEEECNIMGDFEIKVFCPLSLIGHSADLPIRISEQTGQSEFGGDIGSSLFLKNVVFEEGLSNVRITSTNLSLEGLIYVERLELRSSKISVTGDLAEGSRIVLDPGSLKSGTVVAEGLNNLVSVSPEDVLILYEAPGDNAVLVFTEDGRAVLSRASGTAEAGTIEELRDLIGRDTTIILTSDLIMDEDDGPVSTVEDQGNYVTLDLNGHSITGNGKNRIFNVEDNDSLIICNSSETESVLTGGLDSYGGAIYAQGNLDLSGNIKITGNVATQYGGGAICSDSNSLTISDGVIICNNYSDTEGGGIICSGYFSMRDSKIEANEARSSGGGICFNNPEKAIRIRNSNIDSNIAAKGAGIFLGENEYGNAVTATIDGCSISNNACGGKMTRATIAPGDIEMLAGAGIYNDGHDVVLNNVRADRNEIGGSDHFVQAGIVGNGTRGGFVYSKNGSVTVDGADSLIMYSRNELCANTILPPTNLQSGQVELSRGGAFYLDDSDLYLKQGSVMRSYAHNGGAIYAENNSMVLLGDTCDPSKRPVIESNTAVFKAGALFSNSCSQVRIINADIRNNIGSSYDVVDSTLGVGGILADGNSMVELGGGSITGNMHDYSKTNAEDSGSGLDIRGNSRLIIDSGDVPIIITGNAKTYDGNSKLSNVRVHGQLISLTGSLNTSSRISVTTDRDDRSFAVFSDPTPPEDYLAAARQIFFSDDKNEDGTEKYHADLTENMNGLLFAEAEKHNVTYSLNNDAYGTVTADKDSAIEGESVTFTVLPSAGSSISNVFYRDGDLICDLEKLSDTTYRLVMPDHDVNVEVTFAEPSIELVNLNLDVTYGGSLTFNIYFDVTDEALDPDAPYTIRITRIHKFSAVDDQTITMTDTIRPDPDNKYRRKVTYTLAAKEMSDPFIITIIDPKVGCILFRSEALHFASTEFEYSVRQYASALINSDEISYETKRLCGAMLLYGAKAQMYFDRSFYELHPDELATAVDPSVDWFIPYDLDSVTAEDFGGPQYEDNVNDPSICSLEFVSLVLKETPYLKFYLDIADGYSIYGYDSAPSDDGLTRIKIPVRLLRLGDPYTLTVVSDDHSYSKTITYSAFDYCGKILETSSNEDLKDLVKALYFYYEAANAYNESQ